LPFFIEYLKQGGLFDGWAADSVMKAAKTSPARTALKFGRFQVLPHHREFFIEGIPVPLGSRAFDVIMVLQP